MRSKVKISVGVLIIVVLAALVFVNKGDDSDEIPVLAQYENKVVYTTDLSFSKDVLIENCSELGGEFNTCGTPCAPDEVVCTAVCAYTCDF